MSCVHVTKWVLVLIFVCYEIIDANSKGIVQIMTNAMVHMILEHEIN